MLAEVHNYILIHEACLTLTSTLYARSEHGGHKVLPLDGKGYQIEWPHGEKKYRSARQTILALVNKTPDPPPKAFDPRWSFDRYFRIGRYSRESSISVDVFDLFRPDPPNQVIVAVKPALIIPEPSLTVHVPSLPKGIDLAKRGHEVRKLFYAGFASQVVRKGYDPEDVLQEIYKGILIRNNGICPFDQSKSSFGHYVHMVCGCIISNYYRRHGRLSSNEVYGAVISDGTEVDVAKADLEVTKPVQEDNTVYSSLKGSLSYQILYAVGQRGDDVSADLTLRCLDLLLEGMKCKEISVFLGVEKGRVSEAIRLIKDVATDWRESHHI